MVIKVRSFSTLHVLDVPLSCFYYRKFTFSIDTNRSDTNHCDWTQSNQQRDSFKTIKCECLRHRSEQFDGLIDSEIQDSTR